MNYNFDQNIIQFTSLPCEESGVGDLNMKGNIPEKNLVDLIYFPLLLARAFTQTVPSLSQG